MGGWLDTHTCVFHPIILPRISSNGSAPFTSNPHLKPNWTNNQITTNYTSVTLTICFQILVGIFSLGSFAWDLLLGKCRSGSFVWKLSFVILRLGTFVWSFRLEAFVWGFSIWNVRLGTFVLDLSFGNCRLGSFAWYYLLYSAWFGIFRLETCAWDLSLGNFCLGSPEAGGTGWLIITGGTGGDRLPWPCLWDIE